MAVIRDVINVLKLAHRFGPSEDEPEGVRYIQISDTLANELVERLEAHLNMSNKDAIRCTQCGQDMTDSMEHFGLL
jgi:hypothetical protein